MKSLLVLAMLMAIGHNIAFTVIKKEAAVSFTQSGYHGSDQTRYTDPDIMTVTIATGYELNKVTNTKNWVSDKVYVLVNWTDSNTTIITIDCNNYCGNYFEEDCAYNHNYFYKCMTGTDDYGHSWKINII